MERYECQKRSTVHIHEWICFDCDPDIIKFAEMVLKAHMVKFCVNMYECYEFTTGEITSFHKDSTYSDKCISDKKLWTNTELSHSKIKA